MVALWVLLVMSPSAPLPFARLIVDLCWPARLGCFHRRPVRSMGWQVVLSFWRCLELARFVVLVLLLPDWEGPGVCPVSSLSTLKRLAGLGLVSSLPALKRLAGLGLVPALLPLVM